jgi:mRNA interferase YafQ
MVEILWDSHFKRTYRKRLKNNPELATRFADAINIFCKNPYSPSLRTHKLTGVLKGLSAFSVDYNCRGAHR